MLVVKQPLTVHVIEMHYDITSALLEWVDLLSCWDEPSSRSMPYVLGKFTFYFNTGSEGDIGSVRIKQVEFSENARLYFPGTKQTTVIDLFTDTAAILN